MWIASFDIGVRNFAFAIVDDVVPTDHRSPQLRVIYTENIDLADAQGQYSFTHLIDVLDAFRALWHQCAVILIEQQMQHRHATNVKALKVSQHVVMYFHMLFHSFSERMKPLIIEFPAYYKTQMFCRVKMTKPQRKRWAVEYVMTCMPEMKSVMKDHRKKDDMCDCILMCMAYAWRRRGVDRVV
jgi:hypothetical protein